MRKGFEGLYGLVRDSLKRKASLVRGVVLHSGKARPLDADDIALPWGWMVPKSR